MMMMMMMMMMISLFLLHFCLQFPLFHSFTFLYFPSFFLRSFSAIHSPSPLSCYSGHLTLPPVLKWNPILPDKLLVQLTSKSAISSHRQLVNPSKTKKCSKMFSLYHAVYIQFFDCTVNQLNAGLQYNRCSEIHTKPINALSGRFAEFFMLNLVAQNGTTGFKRCDRVRINL